MAFGERIFVFDQVDIPPKELQGTWAEIDDGVAKSQEGPPAAPVPDQPQPIGLQSAEIRKVWLCLVGLPSLVGLGPARNKQHNSKQPCCHSEDLVKGAR